jgi:predicted small lipoprotein YifL
MADSARAFAYATLMSLPATPLRDMTTTPVIARSPLRAPLLIALSLAMASGLGACGRRGPLEPPQGATARAAPAADPRGQSTFAGATTFRPERETETTANTRPDTPPTPALPQTQAPELPVGTGPQTIGAGAAGLRAPSVPRRSAPPETPFVLDPLL